MSIETTYHIKRDNAIKMIQAKIQRAVINNDYDLLADLLYVCRESDFENYIVHADYVDCTDGEFIKTGWG